MKKELLISIIIVFCIIIGDFFLQNYTKSTLNNIAEMLEGLKDKVGEIENLSTKIISSDDIIGIDKRGNRSVNDEIQKKIIEIEGQWDKNFKILTLYLEHDELEKIKTQLVNIKSSIEIQDFEVTYEEIDFAQYLLDHLKEKQKFKIGNIV